MSRIERYEDFEQFANGAEALFNGLLAADSRAEELSTFYSFYAKKGGAMGGVDKRIVEVFFGNRAIDHVKTFESQDRTFPQRHSKLLSERGASLRYERTDTGTVICTLFPAETKASRQREDSILLEWITNPRSLHSKRKVGAHWRSLISYMQCTSVDGEPTTLDKLRIGYLRFTRRLIVDGRAETTRIVAAIESAFRYALTIGLSGFLLTLINVFGGSKEAEKQQAELVSLTRVLSDAHGLIKAQSERIVSLEQRVDAMQRTAQGPNPAVNRTLRDKAPRSAANRER